MLAIYASIIPLSTCPLNATVNAMIRWNVKPFMEKRGWTNASQLATEAGITAPVAYRVLAGEPLERIDVATLERLAAAFRVKPWQLLEHTPDKK